MENLVTAASGLPKVREELYPGEDDYFRRNPHVTGMAAEDDAVILNPYSGLHGDEKHAVIMNEQARIVMRSQARPQFDLTDEQRTKFANYSSNEQDIKETLAARLLSGDPSAGTATPQQSDFVALLKQLMYSR